MGLRSDSQFQNDQRLLNRDLWSSRVLSRSLLRLLLRAFVPPDQPVVLGLDDHIERRRGAKIAAKGIYRDGVRSSKSFFVKTSGLRWLSLMLLTSIPWAKRVWARPFLTVLAPSERYHQQRGRPHKKLTDHARQMMGQVRRWLPNRQIVVTAESRYAVRELLAAAHSLPQPVTMVTRLRLDAALSEPAAPRKQGPKGAPRKQGTRQPTLAVRLLDPTTLWEKTRVRGYGGSTRQIELASGTAVWYHSGTPVVPIRWVLIRDPLGKFEPQARLSTEQSTAPQQIVEWVVQRWQVEVTFEEARAQLGVETQRHWSELAIVRTTSALLGRFSLVSLFAHQLLPGQAMAVRQAAWYQKELPTFSDTLALVRQQLWPISISWMSGAKDDVVIIPKALFDRLTDTLAYAA
jgi:DDE superfamily endonuclease